MCRCCVGKRDANTVYSDTAVRPELRLRRRLRHSWTYP